MLYVRKLFPQDLKGGKQIAFPKEPSILFFDFDYINKEKDRKISFTFKAAFNEFAEHDGKVINTRLYASGSESRMDGEVKAFIRDVLNAKVDDLLICKNKGKQHTDYEVMFLPQSNPLYPMLLALTNGDNHSVCYTDDYKSFDNDNSLSRQQIYYGAPGTGKSHTINERTEGDDTVVRTTFHPDSDYSTFVGAYKPILKETEKMMQVVTDFTSQKAIYIPVEDKKGDAVHDNGITYKFVKQAFLKAYIQAWEKMCKATLINNDISSMPQVQTEDLVNKESTLPFEVNNIKYTIVKVSDNQVSLSRDFEFRKNDVKNVWAKLWSSGEFLIPKGVQSGRSVQIAVCRWIVDNLDNATGTSFEDGWGMFLEILESENVPVSVAPDSKSVQVYMVSHADNSETIHINNKTNSKRERLKKCFEGVKPKGVEIGLIEILKKFDSKNFEEAWRVLMEEKAGGHAEYADIYDEDVVEPLSDNYTFNVLPQYLIIEEINRGNCAQIFGDIFQLLDRGDEGFSQYPIVADEDLRKELKSAFNDLVIDDIVKNVIDNVFKSNYPNGVVDKVLNGEVLVFPCNLYIWATMNTSDQSLFPIDSAFKRRWDWKYIKIKNEEKNWTIEGDQDWWGFLKKINTVVADMTTSADKQLGYYFCKANNAGVISVDTFVNKVCFYLWNDVFKNFSSDEYAQLFKIKKGDNKEINLTFPDFFDDEGNVIQNIVQQFITNVMNYGESKEKTEDNQESQEAQA